MRTQFRLVIALSLSVISCQRREQGNTLDTARVQQPADSAATSSRGSQPTPTPVDTSRPAGSGGALASGKEPGTIPATPTPSVTTDNSIATMRQHLQRLDNASVETLQNGMKDHSKMIGDMLTTMRVEVQAAASPTKDAWLLSADSVESDLDRLALANGETLRTAFRQHKARVLRLLDDFRVLIPPKSK